jgi:hypothetical protein
MVTLSTFLAMHYSLIVVSYHVLLYSLNVVNPLKPSCYYMYHQFNIHNSTFCPHSVFMCFVWISEQTVIISLYSIN